MGFDIFLLEVILSGLMTGVMYALVALGFVLIFKASGIFNFAQGVMALFAALALYDFLAEDGWFFAVFGFTLPVWLAIPGHDRGHDCVGVGHRTDRIALSSQAERNYPFHGNHRPRICAGGAWRYSVWFRRQAT